MYQLIAVQSLFILLYFKTISTSHLHLNECLISGGVSLITLLIHKLTGGLEETRKSITAVLWKEILSVSQVYLCSLLISIISTWEVVYFLFVF